MGDLKISFGKRLKTLRRKKGITQEKFAELIELSPRNLSKIETGRTFPSVDTLEKITKKLNCELPVLFDIDNEPGIQKLKSGIVKRINKLNREQLILLQRVLNVIE